ncbi:hypothetical protein JRQ81_005924 [Phrynocephalus forsythii]|uniref:Uncharacterized protein n=1 Tax=Phrynocephalus forsythii TaxID=171643 RepID=A0A9Q0XIZ4_9SAUR|nr:hypothetical protein JRQ81_005924 [Phrynocephalus forsythii]
MTTFTQVASELEVPLADEKMEGPTTKLTYLDIELDTCRQAYRLPDDKLQDLTVRIQLMLNKKKVTLKELQVLVGHLNFACRVIAPSLVFLRRFCNAMVKLRKPHH